MTKANRHAGLISDGELVQSRSDSFVFNTQPDETAGLLLPAVYNALPDDASGPTWIPLETLSQSPSRPPADEDHRKWCDISTMSGGVIDDGADGLGQIGGDGGWMI